MIENTVQTYTVQIMVAGDASDARRICRKFCMEHGFCVTVTATDYVYTGGCESGVIVGCINYPRFPSEPAALLEKASALAERLKAGLSQHSYTLVAADKTMWRSDRPCPKPQLRDFIADFADAKFEALRQHPCSPEDEVPDVTEADHVWSWQEDARAILAKTAE